MDAVLTITDAPTAEQQRVIGSGLAEFNAEQAGYSDSRDLAVLVSDPATQQVVGGLLGRTGSERPHDYRFQIDRQVYPAFERLPDALRGRRAEFYRLMEDPEEALSFSRGQHSGSLGPAIVLARTVDLKGARRLLDVGGGSGAFSITLCRRFPELRATILDFPSVQAAATGFVRDAGMSDRIDFIPGDALTTEWPKGQDVADVARLSPGLLESVYALRGSSRSSTRKSFRGSLAPSPPSNGGPTT